ncbi:hypothetical protein LMG26689_03670 [Achromobacter animicus]|nr:hypothetical protein LMG26689_03670 [Achromobacter animicus]
MVRCGGYSTAAVALKRESATTTRRLATAITNAASIGKFFDNGPDGCIENSGSQMMDADGVAFWGAFQEWGLLARSAARFSRWQPGALNEIETETAT